MSTRPKTHARAVEIRDALQSAFDALGVAQTELRRATELARTDYPHNHESIHMAAETVGLVRRHTISDLNAWDGYARAREAR